MLARDPVDHKNKILHPEEAPGSDNVTPYNAFQMTCNNLCMNIEQS